MRKAFVVVKLKVFKVLRTNSASMKGPFWEDFRSLLPQIRSKFSPKEVL